MLSFQTITLTDNMHHFFFILCAECLLLCCRKTTTAKRPCFSLWCFKRKVCSSRKETARARRGKGGANPTQYTVEETWSPFYVPPMQVNIVFSFRTMLSSQFNVLQAVWFEFELCSVAKIFFFNCAGFDSFLPLATGKSKVGLRLQRRCTERDETEDDWREWHDICPFFSQMRKRAFYFFF